MAGAIDASQTPLIFSGAARRPLMPCLLYTSDAADERSSVDLGGRRIIKKKQSIEYDASMISRLKTKDTRTYIW